MKKTKEEILREKFNKYRYPSPLDGQTKPVVLEAMEAYHAQFEQWTNRNWDEDFKLENGNYQNKCVECGSIFLGYKRRVVCKVCANSVPNEGDLKAMSNTDAYALGHSEGCKLLSTMFTAEQMYACWREAIDGNMMFEEFMQSLNDKKKT